MRFPITDAALREMAKLENARTPQARKVVRKGSTAFPTSEEDTGGEVEGPTGRGQFVALNFTGHDSGTYGSHGHEIISPFGAGGGGFQPWPALSHTQVSRVNLTGCEQMRLVVHNLHAGASNEQFVYPVANTRAHWEGVDDGTFEGDWRLMDGSSIPNLTGDPQDWNLPNVQPRLSLGLTGSYYTNWAPIAPVIRRDLFLGFAITLGPGHEYRIGLVQLQVRWGFGDAQAGGELTFNLDAPGRLSGDAESGYYAYWHLLDPPFGYASHGAAKEIIQGALRNSSGWQQAGIQFEYESDPEAASVTFQVVEEATCDVPELACTHPNYYGPGTALVELEYPHLEQQVYPAISANSIINHEVGHAFFGADHSGTGIMNTFDNNRPSFPTAADIASVRDWLGI